MRKGSAVNLTALPFFYSRLRIGVVNPAPGSALPVFPGIVNTNPNICAQLRTIAILCNPQFRAGDETVSVKVLVHLQILRQLCRPVMHSTCPNQHTLGLFWFPGNHIHQPVHAITKIHIDHAAFPVEQFRSGCSPLGSMTRQIFAKAAFPPDPVRLPDSHDDKRTPSSEWVS